MTYAPVIRIRARVPQWTFAERLRKARRDTGLSQAKMAQLLDVKATTYGAWETGRNSPPDILGLSDKLERVTGISRFWFRGDLDGNGPDGGGVGPEGLEPPASTVKSRHLRVLTQDDMQEAA